MGPGNPSFSGSSFLSNTDTQLAGMGTTFWLDFLDCNVNVFKLFFFEQKENSYSEVAHHPGTPRGELSGGLSSDPKEMHVVHESWWSGGGFSPAGHACFGHRIERKWFVFLGFPSVHLIRQGTHAPSNQTACFQGQHLGAADATILRIEKVRVISQINEPYIHLLSSRWI